MQKMVQGDTGSAHVAQTVIATYLTYLFFLFFGLEFFLHERESNSESKRMSVRYYHCAIPAPRIYCGKALFIQHHFIHEFRHLLH